MEEKFMKEALKEAKKAYNKLEVPVGAVIVKNGKIIARGYNQKETKTDTTKHAEIIAIQKASQKLKAWRLLDCEMYVTLEPCSMCAGAIINSRIKKVYYGTSDNKTGAVGSVLNLFEDFTFNHKVEYEKNIMQTECENILKQFFKELKMYKKSTQKIINRIIFIVIIFAILCGIGIYILKYEVQGETNIPFEITKIAIAQSVNGIENEGHQEKWNFNVSENNDIYIYLEKNSRYNKTEIIKDVTINNIKINKTDSIGETKIYKPVEDEKVMFKNTNENETEEIVYTGEMESNIKQQKISNQGGIIAFRYAINNLSNYISNENEEVDYGKLLQLTNIKEENIKTTISFDFIITLTTNRKYQTNIQIDIPAKEVIEKGVAGIELTEFNNLIFKRIEN